MGSLSQQLRALRGTPLGTGCPFIAELPTDTHSHSDWGRSDTPVHLMCTSLGCGRKLGYLEKTHIDMGGMEKLHIGYHPGREFFSHQHCNETMLNGMTFENLLYSKDQTNKMPIGSSALWVGLGSYMWHHNKIQLGGCIGKLSM